MWERRRACGEAGAARAHLLELVGHSAAVASAAHPTERHRRVRQSEPQGTQARRAPDNGERARATRAALSRLSQTLSLRVIARSVCVCATVWLSVVLTCSHTHTHIRERCVAKKLIISFIDYFFYLFFDSIYFIQSLNDLESKYFDIMIFK